MAVMSQDIRPGHVESMEERWREKKEERSRCCLGRHGFYASAGSATVKTRGKLDFLYRYDEARSAAPQLEG